MEEPASKKPMNSAFQQQRLPSWQPLLTPNWVILIFLVIGVTFIGIGIGIKSASDSVVETETRYDTLANGGYNYVQTGGLATPCDLLSRSNCALTFNISITKDMNQPVYFYYKLTNFYQNHRRYVSSRSDTQLAGGSSPDLSTCTPLTRNEFGQTYYPCGLIAYSFFNDTFGAQVYRADGTSQYLGDSSSSPLNSLWQKNGIAWSTDKSTKFLSGNFDANTMTRYGPFNITLPDVTDEDFMVWMRTAGLPTFRKLYRIINTDLKAGDIFQVTVNNTYPVGSFNGQKSVVLSTTSWMGGKNDFLGYAYLVVGSLCTAIAIAFFIKHKLSPAPTADLTYFNRPSAQ